MSATVVPQVGGDFGDYRIDALLGRGAMGVVYRAWQRRMNRPVALKVLPADLADDPAYRARFAREAAALAQLDSPHVIQIYDHGDLDGHLLCFVLGRNTRYAWTFDDLGVVAVLDGRPQVDYPADLAAVAEFFDARYGGA